jgi:hypothetical protein
MTTRSKTEIYLKEYPGQVVAHRKLAGDSEPSLIFGLWLLLARQGVRLTWGDTEVLSGQALQFVYARDPQRARERSVVSPLDTLSRALGITWTEITPSSSIKAFEVACDWLADGTLCLARFRQPLLLIGYAKTNFEPNLLTMRIEHQLPAHLLTRSECDRFEWRLQIDEGNSLLRVNYVEELEPDWMALLPQVVRRAIANWRHEPLEGIDVGLAAYRRFAEDLRNPELDFTTSESPSWMGPLLYRQATARTHVHQFLDRLAPRFGGKPRQVLTKASTNYGQAAVAWRDFNNHLGRVYEREELGKSLRGPDAHVIHWRDMGRRQEAAKLIDQAALWEGRAITELAKLLGT